MQGNRIIVLSLVFASGGLAACGRSEGGVSLPPVPATAAPMALPVETAVLAPSRLVVPVRATGTAVAARIAEIGSPFAARVESIAVAEGDRVEEGALLLRLDDAQSRLQVSQANASATAARVQADQARADRERLAPLAERGSIASSRVDQLGAQAAAAEAQAAAARSATSAARKLVGDAAVRAPFAGTVVDIGVELGELANRPGYLVRLVDLSTLEITVRVAARHLADLAPGDRVVARFPDLKRTVEGTVTRLGHEVDPATRTVEVVAAIQNPDGTIPSGVFVEVEITPQSKREGLAVPRSAVAQGEAGAFVYRVDGGVARAMPVTVEPLDTGRVVLVSGVEAGVTLVMSGVDGLVDGAAITSRTAAPAAAVTPNTAPAITAPANTAPAAVKP